MSDLDWTVAIACMSAVLFLSGLGLLVYYALKPVREKNPPWYDGQPDSSHVEAWERATEESQRRSSRRRSN